MSEERKTEIYRTPSMKELAPSFPIGTHIFHILPGQNPMPTEGVGNDGATFVRYIVRIVSQDGVEELRSLPPGLARVLSPHIRHPEGGFVKLVVSGTGRDTKYFVEAQVLGLADEAKAPLALPARFEKLLK